MNELESLGWRHFFAAQLDPDTTLVPARVLAVHRGRVEVAGDGLATGLSLSGNAAALQITVGDWLLVDREGPRIGRRLDRFGVFKRGAAGTSRNIQYIAANVDTLFIVTSANRDFNVARLERYLAIAHEAGAFPVIVITKTDTVESADAFVAEAAKLGFPIVPQNQVEDANPLECQAGLGDTSKSREERTELENERAFLLELNALIGEALEVPAASTGDEGCAPQCQVFGGARRCRNTPPIKQFDNHLRCNHALR